MKISHRFFQHKFLNKPPIKLLKDHDIPTILDYNKDTQPLKCKTTCAQLEFVNKEQMCEEAFEHYD